MTIQKLLPGIISTSFNVDDVIVDLEEALTNIGDVRFVEDQPTSPTESEVDDYFNQLIHYMDDHAVQGYEFRTHCGLWGFWRKTEVV